MEQKKPIGLTLEGGLLLLSGLAYNRYRAVTGQKRYCLNNYPV
jgi:hypothetical protein